MTPLEGTTLFHLFTFSFDLTYFSTNIRISYPQILTEGPSSETLLKSLWKHANTYYFKKIEDA